jgi:hypothetical protein
MPPVVQVLENIPAFYGIEGSLISIRNNNKPVHKGKYM